MLAFSWKKSERGKGALARWLAVLDVGDRRAAAGLLPGERAE